MLKGGRSDLIPMGFGFSLICKYYVFTKKLVCMQKMQNNIQLA
jgi:hypothetical protein